MSKPFALSLSSLYLFNSCYLLFSLNGAIILVSKLLVYFKSSFFAFAFLDRFVGVVWEKNVLEYVGWG